MIELRDVVKAYVEANGNATRALDGVSLSFADGELTVILGPSGSGKSTLVRMLNRMVEPDSGRVLIDGVEASAMDPVALRRSTGYVIQSVGLFPHMSVAENIAVVPRLLGWDRDRTRARVDELLDLVRLPRAYGNRRPHQLSGGEAQRVGVARALAADPRVLLMDEPFGALDALTRETLQAEFARIQRDLRKTVVFVTHDVGEAVRLADAIVVMNAGKVVVTGRPSDLAGAMPPGFAEDFLGSRLGIELLGRVRASDRADFRFGPAAAGAVLPPTASLRDALARMLAEGTTEVTVSRAGGGIGRLDLSMLVRAPHAGSTSDSRIEELR